MLFCCLWRNVETSCHKHFAFFSAINKHQRSDTTCVTWSDGVVFITPIAGSSVYNSEARYRLRIVISAYPTCIRRAR